MLLTSSGGAFQIVATHVYVIPTGFNHKNTPFTTYI